MDISAESIDQPTSASAQPDAPELSQLEAWYMDDDTVADQRKPHRRSPNAPASVAQLNARGVLTWRLDPDAYATCPRLKAIRERRGYSYEARFIHVSTSAFFSRSSVSALPFAPHHLPAFHS